MRLLWVSDSPTLFTGFATVGRELLRRFQSALQLEVACIGRAFDGWPYDRNVHPYPIFPSDPRTFGADAFPRALDYFKPDVVLALGDPWMLEWHREEPRRAEYRLLLYVTLDGTPLPPAWLPVLRSADRVVACSYFGRDVISAADGELETEVIYHGVDAEVFRPLSNRDELRRRGNLEGRFIVGCVARNQPRKNYPALLRAFAEFRDGKEDALLYMHADPDDMGWDLRDLVRRYGLDDCAFTSRSASVRAGVTPGQLNEIFNVFDVLAHPAAAEGFGLPILEAMAAGVPVLATRHSACIELVEGRGEFVETAGVMTMGPYNIDHAIVDESDLAGKLDKLYRDPELRRRHIQAGLKFARETSWDAAVAAWGQLLRGLDPPQPGDSPTAK